MGTTGTKYLPCLMAVFLIAGMFMDTGVAMTRLAPLFAPQTLAQGINPIHLGVILCFNPCIGLITPPPGKCLIVVSAMTGVNYWRLTAAAAMARIIGATTAQAKVKIALNGPPDLAKSGFCVWADTFAQSLRAAGMEGREPPRGAVSGEAEVFVQTSTGLLEVSLWDRQTHRQGR
ncbi:MAG: hypothetical protein ACJA1L_001144 [Paracoccaceae bacterium]|jgi:hypothetical protein